MFKGLSEVTGGSLLRPVTTLPYLVPIGQVQVKIQVFNMTHDFTKPDN